MTRKGNLSPAVFNYKHINTTERAIQRNTIHCIYNDDDNHDSFIGAWVVDQYFNRHPSRRYHTKDYFDKGHRIPSGFIFLLGVVPDIETMTRLIDNAINVCVVSNSPFQKHILTSLLEKYDNSKFQVIYDVSQTIPQLTNLLFSKKKKFPLLDEYETLLNSKRRHRQFVDGMDVTPMGFSSLNRINDDVTYVDKIITTGKHYGGLVDVYWDSLKPINENTLGFIETCGMRIPVIEINQPSLKDGIVKYLLEHLGEPTVGVVYPSSTNTRVHIRTSSKDVDLELIANSFGSKGRSDVCSFTLDNVEVGDFF